MMSSFLKGAVQPLQKNYCGREKMVFEPVNRVRLAASGVADFALVAVALDGLGSAFCRVAVATAAGRLH